MLMAEHMTACIPNADSNADLVGNQEYILVYAISTCRIGWILNHWSIRVSVMVVWVFFFACLLVCLPLWTSRAALWKSSYVQSLLFFFYFIFMLFNFRMRNIKWRVLWASITLFSVSAGPSCSSSQGAHSKAIRTASWVNTAQWLIKMPFRCLRKTDSGDRQRTTL